MASLDNQTPSDKQIEPKSSRLDAFSCRVRRSRKVLALTISDFATATGIPVSTIKNYELGHSNPTAKNLQKMFVAGVNPMFILLGQAPILIEKPTQTTHNKAKIQIAKRQKAISDALESNWEIRMDYRA